MVIMVMINLNQAKLMNEENWVKNETTEMRKNVKNKDEEEKWRIGKEIAGSEMEEKREETQRNEKQQQEKRKEMSRNIEEIVTMV